jgi:ABC-type transport system involved in multi-copper enzyme maturation permease subunit
VFLELTHAKAGNPVSVDMKSAPGTQVVVVCGGPIGTGGASQDLHHELMVDLWSVHSVRHCVQPVDQHLPSERGIGSRRTGTAASAGFLADPVGSAAPALEQQAILDDFARHTDVARILARSAANVYTSGQLLNLMFIVVLGALIVTNEYFHQTATATFLATPHRTRVIVAKLVAGVGLATGFWFVTTAINVGIGALNFTSTGYGFPFRDPDIVRSVAMNLLAYVIWAVLGIGLGVLIQSQLGATITAAALYWISWPVAVLLFGIIRQFVIHDDRVWQFVVLLPGVASFIMVSTERLQFAVDTFGPPWWVGAVVLLGYGLVAGVVGTLITRKRDIS